MISRTLTGATPPTRAADDLPWSSVTVEESTVASGPWTAVDTQVLSPVDVDPSDPASRDITFESELVSGYFRLFFTDANGNTSVPTDPVFDGPLVAYAPTIEDIGALLRARTVDTNGNELGTFTSDTRPTATQVQRMIRQAAADVQARVGIDIPADANELVKSLITIRAAMKVELSYFPEQVAAGNSVYPNLTDDYKETATAVREAVDRETAEEMPPGGTVDSPTPSFFFPEDAGGMIGWGTKW